MRFRLFFAIFGLSLGLGELAHASGPVERLQQVLLHPTDPNVIVVRWGVASQGFLYSRDGGRTFVALCSEAITPLAGVTADAGVSPINKLSSVAVNSNGGTLIDGAGHVLVTQLRGLWSDDGTGCTWSQSLEGNWPTSLALDPKTGELLAVVNVQTGEGASTQSRALLVRRDASGSWTSYDQAGELVPHVAGQLAYGGELKVVATSTGTRLYASVALSPSLTAAQQLYVVKSDDGGKTWSAGAALPAVQSENFSLVAVDPADPKRLLGASTDDVAADVLFLSEDEGSTFTEYSELRELTGVAFGPDNKVYITDQGDAVDSGGMWTAAQLGQPLSKVAGTSGLDCVTWSQAQGAFYVCQGDRVRTFDPASASFVGDNVVRISEVDGQLSCPNADIGKLCQSQLNAGASWCCTGHYPCTAFCGDYDVTMAGTQRVFCGKSGLAYDIMAGRTCDKASASSDGGVTTGDASTADAGAVDAGARDAGSTDGGKVMGSAKPRSESGCSVGEPRKSQLAGLLMSLGLLLMVLGRNLRARDSARK